MCVLMNAEDWTRRNVIIWVSAVNRNGRTLQYKYTDWATCTHRQHMLWNNTAQKLHCKLEVQLRVWRENTMDYSVELCNRLYNALYTNTSSSRVKFSNPAYRTNTIRLTFRLWIIFKHKCSAWVTLIIVLKNSVRAHKLFSKC